jgi:hypothetical protein
MDESAIVGVAVLASSIWVLFDANKLMIGLTKEERRSVSSRGALSPAGWFLVSLLLWIIGFPWYVSIRNGYAAAQARKRAAITQSRPPGVPGRYVVVGVDRETKLDTTWRVTAANRENARVKAELEGIIVTSIEMDDERKGRGF